MGKTVQINGKKYDATTGKLIRSNTAKQSKRAAAPTSIDGVVPGARAKRATKRTSAKRSPAKPVVKTPQKSRTLMRTAVKKPSAKKSSTTPISKSQLGTSRARSNAARTSHKSPHVSKFNGVGMQPQPVKKVVKPMSVKAHPATRTARPSLAQRKKAANVAGRAASAATVAKKNVAAAKLIESALERADAHTQPAHTPAKKRTKLAHKLGISARAMSVSAAVLAAVLLGGFFALQNVPNLSMRVAAARAGLDATLPKYNPSGFTYNGPIQYSPGKVTISFRSTTDDRNYDLIQSSSNWSSESLLDNFVVEGNTPYQTFEDRGRTLYIYGGSNATWVDNGIWYQIEGDSRMSTDQLIRVAASM